MNVNLSFLIVFNKSRNNLVKGIINNVGSFFNERKEIILAEQNNEEVFRLGQMRNLAFKKSSGDILVFLDVDMRFKNKINFKELCETLKQPYLPWDRIINVKEENGKLIEIEERENCLGGYGGCVVYTRKQFEKSMGFSNLIAGWGGEDNVINQRLPLLRLRGIIYHVAHDYKPSSSCASKLAIRNRDFWKTDRQREKNEDSYEHTIADQHLVKCYGEVKHYFFEKIRVPDKFKYHTLYEELTRLV